jgi:low affinity Fe/Cu permease
VVTAQKHEKPQPVPPDQKKPPVEIPPDQPGLPDERDSPPEGDPPANEPTRLKSRRSKTRRMRIGTSQRRAGALRNGSHKRGVVAHARHASEALAHRATRFTGSTTAFAIAVTLILVWIVTGPVFGFSDTWQLVINTGTTVVTFLMVFLIQRAQNKDALAIHLKLNELVAAQHGASNRLVNVEDLTEDDLATLHQHYRRLAEMAEREQSLTKSHSVEEAESRHRSKQRRPAARG